MKALTQNPFRILGLPANARPREIERNKARIKAYSNVGKTVSFPLDLDFLLGPVPRSVQDVQIASNQVEQNAGKLENALFWFTKVPSSSFDEIALSHLDNENAPKASEIWEKTLRNSVSDKNFSSYNNLGTLALIQAFQNGRLNKSSLKEGLRAKGALLSSAHFADFVKLIAGDKEIPDPVRVGQDFVDLLIQSLQAYLDRPGGISVADLFDALGFFPDGVVKHLEGKFVDRPIQEVEKRIEQSQEKREEEPEEGTRIANWLLQVTRKEIKAIQAILPSNHIQLRSTLDKLAEEVLQCSIDDYNATHEYDDMAAQRAVNIIEEAEKLARGPHVRNRIRENKQVVEEAAEFNRTFGRIKTDMDGVAKALKRFQTASESTTSVSNLLRSAKPHLDRIKSVVGSHDQNYLMLSSAVAGNALGMLIAVINSTQESLKWRGASGLADVRRTVNQVINLMNQISPMDMEPELRQRFNTNMSTLRSIKSQLNQVANQQTYSSSGGGGGGGCYIATMAYGDYDHPQVRLFRRYRDEVLLKNLFGKTLVKTYYALSPALVRLLKDKKQVNTWIRKVLDQLAKQLQ